MSFGQVSLANVLFFGFVRGWFCRFSKLACWLRSVVLVNYRFHSAGKFLNQFVRVGQSWLSIIWRSGKIWFLFRQQDFESILFWLVKVFDYLAFWQVKFLVVAKVKVVCKNFSQLAVSSFFSQ